MADLPLLVLGGYLGAGKTTLINELLRAQGDRTVTPSGPGSALEHPLRIGVLVNDFGALNIDAELIEAQAGETVALTNGCACCSIQDDLGEAFESLCGISGDLDLVLVEASGVAHPDKIAAFGHTWPGLRPGPIVVAADSTRLAKLWRDKFVGQLVQRQIAVADHVILTRADLAAEEVWSRATSLAHTTRADTWTPSPGPTLGSKGVLDPFARNVVTLGGAADPALTESPANPETTTSTRTGSALPTHAEDAPGFSSGVFRWSKPIDVGRFEATLRQVASEVERLKGFVQTLDGPYLVQATPTSFSITPVESELSTPLTERRRTGQTELVLIAPSGAADVAALTAALERAAQ